MNRKVTITITAVLAAALLALQVFIPVFRGEANLSLPDRIRTFFTDLFGEEEETETEEFIELEQQPETGVELPVQVLDETDVIELPQDGGVELPQSGEENELPVDVFR